MIMMNLCAGSTDPIEQHGRQLWFFRQQSCVFWRVSAAGTRPGLDLSLVVPPYTQYTSKGGSN
jgi:hypothetical protein